MHKYLPKLYVIPLKKEQANMSQELLLRQFEDLGIPEYSEEFTFPETAFITVTAYQNQQVSCNVRAYVYLHFSIAQVARSVEESRILSIELHCKSISQIKHEYLQFRAYKCLSLSSSSIPQYIF